MPKSIVDENELQALCSVQDIGTQAVGPHNPNYGRNCCNCCPNLTEINCCNTQSPLGLNFCIYILAWLGIILFAVLLFWLMVRDLTDTVIEGTNKLVNNTITIWSKLFFEQLNKLNKTRPKVITISFHYG